MALPKKASRKIVVNNQQFTWLAAEDDDWMYITLYVVDAEVNGQKLVARFDYHFQDEPNGENTYIVHRSRIEITPFVVRQVILLGLEKGWKPRERGPDLKLSNLDNIIDKKVID